MKKDIYIPEVKDVYVAAVLEEHLDGDDVWDIYFINNKDEALEGVLVTSRGYVDSEKGIETVSSTLRHKLGNLQPKSAAKIEIIDSQVFEIYNEYWVTFFCAGKLLERKFIFGPYTIDKNFLEAVPVLTEKGILVK